MLPAAAETIPTEIGSIPVRVRVTVRVRDRDDSN